MIYRCQKIGQMVAEAHFWTTHKEHLVSLLLHKFWFYCCHSFDSTKVLIFCTFGLKTPIHANTVWFFVVFDPQNRVQYESNPSKVTSLHETHHMMYRSSISIVWLTAILDLRGTFLDDPHGLLWSLLLHILWFVSLSYF